MVIGLLVNIERIRISFEIMKNKGLTITNENLAEYEDLKLFVEDQWDELFQFLKDPNPREIDLLSKFYQPSYEAFDQYNRILKHTDTVYENPIDLIGLLLILGAYFAVIYSYEL